LQLTFLLVILLTGATTCPPNDTLHNDTQHQVTLCWVSCHYFCWVSCFFTNMLSVVIQNAVNINVVAPSLQPKDCIPCLLYVQVIFFLLTVLGQAEFYARTLMLILMVRIYSIVFTSLTRMLNLNFEWIRTLWKFNNASLFNTIINLKGVALKR
jgi:hypothetical protein